MNLVNCLLDNLKENSNFRAHFSLIENYDFDFELREKRSVTSDKCRRIIISVRLIRRRLYK